MYSRSDFRFGRVALALLAGLAASAAHGAVPPPANDTPAGAINLGTSTRATVRGTTQSANNDGIREQDVYYTFTPTVSGTYRFNVYPWQFVTLRTGSSERRLGITVLGPGGEVGQANAPGGTRPILLEATLNAGEAYTIVVGANNAITPSTVDQSEFTLVVGQVNPTKPDNCALVEAIPNSSFPTAVMQNLDFSNNDFTFSASGGQCSPDNTADGGGADHVYSFTAPSNDIYSFELIHAHQGVAATGFNGLLHLNTACDLSGTCLGASNNITTHTFYETLATPLSAGQTVFIFVDEALGSAVTGIGPYAVVVGRGAADHGISEREPNDSTSDPETPNSSGSSGGQLVGDNDVDFWAIPGNVNDRVYVWANPGGTGTGTTDINAEFLDAGGGVIEFDDDDSEGWPSPFNDLHFIYSTSAPVIAGAKFTSTGTHYIRVFPNAANAANARYRLHWGVVPATLTPSEEVEPNETPETANISSKRYYAGTYDFVGDRDFFKFTAEVGDRVFIAADGDPERNNPDGRTPHNTAGSNSLNVNMQVIDPAGDQIIGATGAHPAEGDDNGIDSGTTLPDHPGQAIYFIARTAGEYTIEVTGQNWTTVMAGPEKTYELAIFLNDSIGPQNDPSYPAVAITPDTMADTIAVAASDNAAGDTGLCSVSISPNDNLQIVGGSSLPSPTSNFTISLVNTSASGSGVLRVMDCSGNEFAEFVRIDVSGPQNTGQNIATRTVEYFGEPVYVTDNNIVTPTDIPLNVADTGTVTKAKVTVWTEHLTALEVDLFLVSPQGTEVELVTDRGSSSATEFTATTFDDAAAEIVPLLSSAAPYTGSFKPEDAAGLAEVNGQNAQGNWLLRAFDDASTNSNGYQVLRWRLELEGTFPTRQEFRGSATEPGQNQVGIQSIELLGGATNVALSVPTLSMGAASVSYSVTLVNSSLNGSGTVRITDVQGNSTDVAVSLTGAPDNTAPVNNGETTTQIRREAESQTVVPLSSGNQSAPVYAAPVSTVWNLTGPGTVADVDVDLTVNSDWIGRLGVWVNKDSANAVLMNMIGNTNTTGNPYPIGMSKDNVFVYFDDESAGVDAHAEPVATSTPFLGTRQPDGRIGDDTIAEPHLLEIAITSHPRDNLLSVLDGLPLAGAWTLNVADVRAGGAGNFHKYRRSKLVIDVSGGAEHYYGVTTEAEPQTGVCTIALAPGATNLTVVSSFTPGAKNVEYRVELTDPNVNGSGTLVITDCAGNPTNVPISLAAPGGGGPTDCEIADFNNDGTVQPADIFFFLDAWFTQLCGTPGCATGASADIDGNGMVQPADIFFFLDKWFANLGPC